MGLRSKYKKKTQYLLSRAPRVLRALKSQKPCEPPKPPPIRPQNIQLGDVVGIYRPSGGDGQSSLSPKQSEGHPPPESELSAAPLVNTPNIVQIGGSQLPKNRWTHKKPKWIGSARNRKLVIKKLKKARLCVTRRSKNTPTANHSPLPVVDTPGSSPTTSNSHAEASEPVFMESVRRYSRVAERFNATEQYEEFRFVNLDRLHSSDHGVIAIHQGVQMLIERLLHDVGPNDFFQMRFQGQGLNSPLFTRRSSRDVFDAVTFLENLSKLLQSKAELLVYGSFRIIILVVRGRKGGASRTLKSFMYSKIIGKKSRWLLDFNTGVTNMCLAASIAGLLVDRSTPDAVIMSMGIAVHEALQLPSDRMVGFGDLGLFENHFAVPVKVLYHNGSWKYFTTNEGVKNKTVYVLHHENHFYSVLNLKGFLGAKYMCEHCDHIYNNRTKHQCELHCKMCQRDGCVNDDTQKVNCTTCKLFCRSQDCLNMHISLAQCVRQADCGVCDRYKPVKYNCKGMQCPRCTAAFKVGTAHSCYMLRSHHQKKTEDYIVFGIECTQETGCTSQTTFTPTI
ncbi:uncharacterized protein [Pleurodeles waltl]|uniref:uncharacterized protein n=1 Tax=Pleurodeles waltl TaxID=8319 RepID=UPI00370965A6